MVSRKRRPFSRSKVRIDATIDDLSPSLGSASSISDANAASDGPPREASRASMMTTPGSPPGQASRTSRRSCVSPSSPFKSASLAIPANLSTDRKTNGAVCVRNSSARATRTPVFPAPGSPITRRLPLSIEALSAGRHSRASGTRRSASSRVWRASRSHSSFV